MSLSKKEIEEEVIRKIPIKISVDILDIKYPWLMNIAWNSRDDEDLEEADYNA